MTASSANKGVTIPISDDAALVFLLELYRYVIDLGVWDLAIEMRSLPALNLTDSDLRWLMNKQLVERLHELSKHGEPRREIRRRGRLILSGRRSFMLTEKGAALARQLETIGRAPQFCPGRASNGDGALHSGTSTQDGLPAPCWDCHRQELRLGNHVIKQFKIPSADQEIVPNAILWGILAATLRFVPYIGPWIAAVMPIGLSLAISTGWVAPILTVALFVVLELFSNNVMEPWLYGKKTGMSAVAVLVAAVFWTWLWGVAGLLLATPLTVCLLVIGKHVPQLSFLNILLGNEPVFEPERRVYQRLLAGDQEEATELVDGALEHKPLVEVYDTILIPALALAETDWHRGELDERRHNYILQNLTEMIHERGEGQPEVHAKEGIEDDNAPRACILCLPARAEADEIAGVMLAQLLATGECLVQSVSVTAAASELVDLVEKRKPDVLCISATPPAAVMHARHLRKQLRGRFPEVPVVVGLWNAQGDLSKAKTRIGADTTTYIVATLAEAREQVRLLIQSRLRRSEVTVHSTTGQ